jgi:hypothetical protein
MADTRSDVAVPAGVWTDLYAGSTITVGTAVDLFNKGSYPANICVKATIPSGISIGIPIEVGAGHNYLHVTAGESGLWAYSASGTSILVQD